MSNNFSFDFQDFRKWISEQEDLSKFFNVDLENPNEDIIGKSTSPKANKVSFLSKAIPIDGDIDIVVDDFFENNGVISKIKDKKVLIEVDSGSFYINKRLIKIHE